jgi:hypothetical protein
MKQVFTLSLILLILITTASFLVPYTLMSIGTETTQFYVGVTFCDMAYTWI